MSELLLYASGAAVLVMSSVWILQYFTKNAGIVDAFWSWTFPLIGVIYFLNSDGWITRKAIMLVMVAIWGIRLGTYLFIRTISHHDQEDVRYARMRNENKPHENRFFFFFFMAQAATNVLLSIPFLFPMQNRESELHPIEYTGVVIWFIGVAFESLADYQLYSFKKKENNKGKVCDAGLWKFSRHPNYFFESVTWIGFAVFASASPYGWISFFAPALIIFLLNKVTGIPMTEELALKSKGEAYKRYQETTNAFIPGKPKAS